MIKLLNQRKKIKKTVQNKLELSFKHISLVLNNAS